MQTRASLAREKKKKKKENEGRRGGGRGKDAKRKWTSSDEEYEDDEDDEDRGEGGDRVEEKEKDNPTVNPLSLGPRAKKSRQKKDEEELGLNALANLNLGSTESGIELNQLMSFKKMVSKYFEFGFAYHAWRPANMSDDEYRECSRYERQPSGPKPPKYSLYLHFMNVILQMNVLQREMKRLMRQMMRSRPSDSKSREGLVSFQWFLQNGFRFLSHHDEDD